MSTPTDPYSSSSDRPFEEDILEPLPEWAEGEGAAEAAQQAGVRTAAEHAAEAQAAAQAEAAKGADAAATAANDAGEAAAQAAKGASAAGAEARADVAASAGSAATAGAQQPKVVGSLSLEEPEVEVHDANIPDAFDAQVEAPQAAAPETPAAPQEARPEATLADGSAYAAPAESAGEGVVRKSVMDNSTATLQDALNVSPLTASSASDIENPFGQAAEAEANWESAPATIDTVPEGPKSRVGAHIGILLGSIVLVPIAWYLLSDSSIRLALLENSPWITGKVSIPVLLEVIGGLVVAGLVWFLARASSLGVFISGLAVTIVGAIGVIMPYFGRNTIAATVTDKIGSLNSLTGNIAHHFALDLGSGRLLFFGFLLLMTSVVSHWARKRGNLAGVQATRRDVALGK